MHDDSDIYRSRLAFFHELFLYLPYKSGAANHGLWVKRFISWVRFPIRKKKNCIVKAKCLASSLSSGLVVRGASWLGWAASGSDILRAIICFFGEPVSLDRIQVFFHLSYIPTFFPLVHTTDDNPYHLAVSVLLELWRNGRNVVEFR